jgi:hypothetical protein
VNAGIGCKLKRGFALQVLAVELAEYILYVPIFEVFKNNYLPLNK